MTQVASSGKVGLISFLIMPNDDDDYRAIITSPNETVEVKCSSWKIAEKIVKKTIKRIEDNQYENERNIYKED